MTTQPKWTPEEDAEIDELAAALRENKRGSKWRSRQAHANDARLLQSWGSAPLGKGPSICVEIRKRMAAREEAFRRAKVRIR